MDSTQVSALDVLLAGCGAAVEEEVLAVREDLRSRGIDAPIPASAGIRIDPGAAGLQYRWTLPAGRYVIRPEDAVRVETERGGGLGFVTAFDPAGPSVRVRLGEWLGPHPGPAQLTFDPTWLLEALAGRLREIGDEPDRFHPLTALRLFGEEYARTGRRPAPPGTDAGLDAAQRAALERAIGSEAQFVWGPPGTGKTRLLGHVVAVLSGRARVLVAATTNVAVDEAAGRIAARLGDVAIDENRLIRVGAEHSATGDPALSLAAALERAERREPGRLTRSLVELEGALLDRADRSETAGLSIPERQARVVALAGRTGDEELLGRAVRLTGEIARTTRRTLDRADVIVTTFARLAGREDLAAQRFGAVVIDEAGAAPLPYALFAACLADGPAIAFGDFQQLPPVVTSRSPAAARWLSRDLFRQAGVVRGEHEPPSGRVVAGDGGGARGRASIPGLPSPDDQLCAMLDRQYRMRPRIRALVSDLFYGGRLLDAPEVEEGSGAALAVLDTTELRPEVERIDGSRENGVHLDVLLQALELLGRAGMHDVGLVTPYRAQTRHLARLARSRLGRLAPEGLEISTIHRFQGREKRVVILDTVDAPPGRSWFLDESRNAEFPRLLNVALSRSRDLLLVVGTMEGLRRTLPAGALLLRVLDRIAADGVRIDASRMSGLVDLLNGAGAGSSGTARFPPGSGRA